MGPQACLGAAGADLVRVAVQCRRLCDRGHRAGLPRPCAGLGAALRDALRESLSMREALRRGRERASPKVRL